MRKLRGRTLAVRPLDRGRVPMPSGLPVDPYRHGLYTPAELYDARPYTDSLDARAYAWSHRPPTHDDTLAQALHDHAVDEGLTEWLTGRHLVGVMGGHDVDRGSPAYADAARLGQLLAGSSTVATGGGPGAMEATNLGAFLADPGDLTDALQRLAAVPSFRPSVDAWAEVALSIVAQTRGRESLGVPTWFYGHEPPNVFATAIAKFFRNAIRESILLQLCDRGIVFLRGAGGTVQEIFQDACENYYAADESVAPMVLVGTAYWTETMPAWPLLQALARGRAMEEHINLVDTVDEAAEVMRP